MKLLQIDYQNKNKCTLKIQQQEDTYQIINNHKFSLNCQIFFVNKYPYYVF